MSRDEALKDLYSLIPKGYRMRYGYVLERMEADELEAVCKMIEYIVVNGVREWSMLHRAE